VPSRWAVFAWINFGLVVAAVFKFFPLLVSLTHGVVLTAEQRAAGLAEDRAWALDLISDTPYLLVVWALAAFWLRRQTGSARLLPWRKPQGSATEQP
jgi:hypothetical protein